MSYESNRNSPPEDRRTRGQEEDVFVKPQEIRQRLGGLRAEADRAAEGMMVLIIGTLLALLLIVATGLVHIRAVRLCLAGGAEAGPPSAQIEPEPSRLKTLLGAGAAGALAMAVYYGLINAGVRFWQGRRDEIPEAAIFESLANYFQNRPWRFAVINGAIALFAYPVAATLITHFVWSHFFPERHPVLCLILNIGLASLVHTLFLPAMSYSLPARAPEPPPAVVRTQGRGVFLGTPGDALTTLEARPIPEDAGFTGNAGGTAATPLTPAPRKTTYEEAEEIAARTKI